MSLAELCSPIVQAFRTLHLRPYQTMSAIANLIDVSPLLPKEQNSDMFIHLMEALYMLKNKSCTYKELDGMLFSLNDKGTGSKTTCVYWMNALRKAGLEADCGDVYCQEREIGPHRICKRQKSSNGRTKVIWLNKKLAQQVFRNL